MSILAEHALLFARRDEGVNAKLNKLALTFIAKSSFHENLDLAKWQYQLKHSSFYARQDEEINAKPSKLVFRAPMTNSI